MLYSLSERPKGENFGQEAYDLLDVHKAESPGGVPVVIPGVLHANFGIHWDMPVRATRALLRFRGVDVDQEAALALSGDAFALCHASHWQGTAYLCTPTNPIRNLVEAYGFRYDSTHAGPTGPLLRKKSLEERLQLTRQALRRIYNEIDASRPVLISGAEVHCGSTSLVVGYDRGREWLCHVGDGRPYRWTPLRGVAKEAVNHEFGLMDGRCRGTVTPGFVGGWQANPAYLIGARIAEPSDQDQIRSTLKLAVDLHGAKEAHRRNWGGVGYYFGAKAYRMWAEELERLRYPADLEESHATNGVKAAYGWYDMGNMDTQVDQIVTGRAAAAAFCRRAAGLAGGSAGRALDQAARVYDHQIDLAHQTFAAFIPRFDGREEPRQAWLSDRRRCAVGAETIRTMLRYESTAIRALEQTLVHLS